MIIYNTPRVSSQSASTPIEAMFWMDGWMDGWMCVFCSSKTLIKMHLHDKHPLYLGGAHPVSKQVVRELDEW